MFESEHKRRVSYADTDKMGYLYYGNYAEYYEVGRTEAIRDLGMTYRDMEDEMKVMLPVVGLEARYFHPAYYDDEIRILTRMPKWPDKLLIFEHELYNQEGTLLNKALVKLLFVSIESGKRCAMPEKLATALRPYFETKL